MNKYGWFRFSGLLETYSTEEFIKYTLRIVETGLELGKLHWTPKKRRMREQLKAKGEMTEEERGSEGDDGKAKEDGGDSGGGGGGSQGQTKQDYLKDSSFVVSK